MSARTVAAIPIAAVLVAFFTWSPPASIDRLLAALRRSRDPPVAA